MMQVTFIVHLQECLKDVGVHCNLLQTIIENNFFKYNFNDVTLFNTIKN